MGTPAASFLFANNSTRLSLAEARANPYQPIGIERRPTPDRSFFDDPILLGWELSFGARELAARVFSGASYLGNLRLKIFSQHGN